MQRALINAGRMFLFSGGDSGSPIWKEYLYYYTKRWFDITVSVCLLLLLSPLMLFIAILISLESNGPIIFVHQRVGCRRRYRDGRVIWEITNFPFYKFRSMVSNADEGPHHAHIRDYVRGVSSESDSTERAPKVRNDRRVTRVGRFIRKTSLDELPQLCNILRGEMSIVGPRPVPTYEFAEYADGHYERLTTLPGITGLWQVKGRALTSFEEQIALDLEYVRNQSLWLDLKIILLTIPAVVSGRGAA